MPNGTIVPEHYKRNSQKTTLRALLTRSGGDGARDRRKQREASDPVLAAQSGRARVERGGAGRGALALPQARRIRHQ